ncbi:hypothetical protein E3N88_18831 [Mikania micrantha]|uniref:Uncharacterized protein n=1 Tax=Mikania micrantha TaxID=192012 RepID=A0A5N6NNX1_9ASTR|nr:hypothetical protein E3N88_18831 [Mikania micrantha]
MFTTITSQQVTRRLGGRKNQESSSLLGLAPSDLAPPHTTTEATIEGRLLVAAMSGGDEAAKGAWGTTRLLDCSIMGLVDQ